MVGNSNVTRLKTYTVTTYQTCHPSFSRASKVLFSFSEFRILQSVNLCCCIRKVNISCWLGAKKSVWKHRLLNRDQLKSPQLKLGIRPMIWLVFVLDQRWLWKSQAFHHCKESGKSTAYSTACPLCNVSKIRRNLVVGEISECFSGLERWVYSWKDCSLSAKYNLC